MGLISEIMRSPQVIAMFITLSIALHGCARGLPDVGFDETPPKLQAEAISIPENFHHAGEYDDGPEHGIVESQAELEAIWDQLEAHDPHGRALSRTEVQYPNLPNIDFSREYVVWVSLLRAIASSAEAPLFTVDNATGHLILTINVNHSDALSEDLVMWRAPKTYPPAILMISHQYCFGP